MDFSKCKELHGSEDDFFMEHKEFTKHHSQVTLQARLFNLTSKSELAAIMLKISVLILCCVLCILFFPYFFHYFHYNLDTESTGEYCVFRMVSVSMDLCSIFFYISVCRQNPLGMHSK